MRGRRRLRIRHAAALAAATSMGLACAEQPEPTASNLLLITIDTLRPDHLGCYGYARETSPAIDRLARTSVVFDRAYGTSSWTLPSIASLFTGEIPSGHGAVSKRSALPSGFETLTERLRSAGFDTAAVVSHVFFAPRYGLDQGFAHYDDELVRERIEASHRAVTSEKISDKGIAWLERRQQDGRRWFLWLHYFDPHADYMVHPGISERFGAERMDLYDGEIAFTDRHVGRVLERLDTLGEAEDTVVIVASDHGEAFGEHGLYGHRISLFEEELRVALMVRAPGVAPRRVGTPVSLADVAPTALALLRIAPIPSPSGRSLVRLLAGERLPRKPLVAELRSALDWRRVDALIVRGWKLTHHRVDGLALYDLNRDPGEKTNVAAARPEIARTLRAEMQRQLGAARSRAANVAAERPAPLDPELREQLEALGYADPPDEAD